MVSNKRKAATKKSLERKQSNREPRKRALIVCEDSVSAPFYLRKLIEHLGLNTVDILICGEECGSAPSSVVQFGEKYLKNDAEFDYVFFVFDRDNHPTYDKALSMISRLKKQYKKIEIYAITSTPCFELWLLLHKSDSAQPYNSKGSKSPADCLIEKLKTFSPFENYSKNSGCDYFDKIKDHIQTAIKNAKLLIKNGKDTQQNDHHINPSTYMHELVIALKEIAAGYKTTL